MTKKIIAIVVSILALTAIGCFVGFNWQSVKALFSGAQIYTAEQMEESYNQGYIDANTNEETYLQQIDYYKNLVEDNELEIENLNNEITNLTNTNVSYQSQITNLNGIIEENESTIESLQSTISDNNTTISGLNTQISSLNNEIDSLESDIEDLQSELSQAEEDYQILQAELTTKTNQVISLQNQVSNLQTLVNQLNATNELNLITISTLNSQIETLNSQISDLTYQINNNDSIVSSLNNKITQLQESISYYENYISNLENETQVVVTFEFDGSVYNIQIINKGTTVSVVNPTSTDYVQFNYWTVNNEQIDLSTYTFNSNTKVVADITYSYDVKFYVDNAVHNSQIIQSGNNVITPTVPTKSGYAFLGWSLNGNDIVNLNTITITENTNFYAVFIQQFTVQFVYEDDIISTQTINNGAYAIGPSVDNTTYKVFNGWKVNGTSVNVDTYKIVGATTFVADITYKYDVIFMVDSEEYDSQIISSGQYATVPTAPTKTDYEFIGWSINGTDIVDISNTPITTNTNFYAIFMEAYGLFDVSTGTQLYTWNELIENNIIEITEDGDMLPGTNVNLLSGKLIVADGVISICTSVEATSIPNDLTFCYTDIVELDLSKCNTLTNVGKLSFIGHSLVRLILPSHNVNYANNAFSNNYNLVEIVNNNQSLEIELGTGMAQHAKSIIDDIEDSKVKIIGNLYYYQDEVNLIALRPVKYTETTFILDDETTEINNYAFYYAESIHRSEISVDFSNATKLINIDDCAFYFANLNIADLRNCIMLTNIGSRAFQFASIEHVILPESTNNISLGLLSFGYCDNLETIYIPNSVTLIDDYALEYNTENLVIYIESNSFSNHGDDYWLPDTYSELKKNYSLEQYLAEIQI